MTKASPSTRSATTSSATDTTIWLDLRDPDRDDLLVLQNEFGLHPVAIEDALFDRERPKIDRYDTHLFMTVYGARLDTTSGELATSELSAFILPHALITIRKDDGLDIGKVVERWDSSPDLARHGVGFLLHGLLDFIVDGHFEAVQTLDDAVEELEDDLFDDKPKNISVHRRSFELRKSLVLLRRIVLPMREVLNTLMRRDVRFVDGELMPYYQDVYDHVLRATEWTESLRDLVTTILETNLTIQGNRMNIITKKVTSWAAIIAVPTFITGFYGMNVPYPGFSDHVGLIVAIAIMLISGRACTPSSAGTTGSRRPGALRFLLLSSTGSRMRPIASCRLRHRPQTRPVDYASDTDKRGRWRR